MEKTNLSQALKSSPLVLQMEQAQKKSRSEKVWCPRTKAYQDHRQEKLRHLWSLLRKIHGKYSTEVSSTWAHALTCAERLLTVIMTWSLRAEEHTVSGRCDSLPGPFPHQ